MITEGIRIGSKFTGNPYQDLSMLRHACDVYYDEEIVRREKILKVPTLPVEFRQACEEGIETLRGEKLKLANFFTDSKEEIQIHIEIYRTMKTIPIQ